MFAVIGFGDVPNFLFRDRVDGFGRFDGNLEALVGTSSSEEMVVFVKDKAGFLDTGFFGVVPARPDVGFAVDGESLDAFGAIETLVFSISAFAFVETVDWTHVIVYYAADDGFIGASEAAAVVFTAPDNGRDGRRVADEPGIFRGRADGGGGGTGF